MSDATLDSWQYWLNLLAALWLAAVISIQAQIMPCLTSGQAAWLAPQNILSCLCVFVVFALILVIVLDVAALTSINQISNRAPISLKMCSIGPADFTAAPDRDLWNIL